MLEYQEVDFKLYLKSSWQSTRKLYLYTLILSRQPSPNDRRGIFLVGFPCVEPGKELQSTLSSLGITIEADVRHQKWWEIIISNLYNGCNRINHHKLILQLSKKIFKYLGEDRALAWPDSYCSVASSIDSATFTLFSISVSEDIALSYFSWICAIQLRNGYRTMLYKES